MILRRFHYRARLAKSNSKTIQLIGYSLTLLAGLK
jgi:hypothetical protein